MDGSGLVGSIECGPELDEIIEGLIIARDRARQDVKAAGLRPDLYPKVSTDG